MENILLWKRASSEIENIIKLAEGGKFASYIN